MELHNHLVRPEQRNVLHIAGDPQSFAEHLEAQHLHATQSVIDAARPTQMSVVRLLTPEVMS